MSDKGIGENGCLCRSKNLADSIFPIWSFSSDCIISFFFSFCLSFMSFSFIVLSIVDRHIL